MTTRPDILNLALAEAISAAIGEPAWARDLRLQAYRAYETTAMPTRRDESWRRLNLSGLDLAAMAAAAPGVIPLPAEAAAGLEPVGVRGGLLAQGGAGSVAPKLDPALAAKGVIYTTLEQALREHGDLVRPHFERHVLAPKAFKFAALNAAFWTGGMFLYVPKGVQVEHPLVRARWLQAGERSLVSRALIVVEPGASVSVIDTAGSAQESGELHCGSIDMVLGQDAELRLTTLQGWGDSVWNFEFTHAWLAQSARLRTLEAALGARLHRSHLTATLEGPGADALMEGVYVGTGTQQFDYHTLQDHVAPHSSSNLLYKGALKDTSRAGYEGVVRMGPEASAAAASQANHNLLLNKGATADSVPVLEILASDVERCNHGATVGQVDPEILYYLQTRGLNGDDARELIVAGFLDLILSKLPSEPLQARVRAAVGQKLAFAHDMAKELA
jgi:Fe-S cluster assembly protein SufD